MEQPAQTEGSSQPVEERDDPDALAFSSSPLSSFPFSLSSSPASLAAFLSPEERELLPEGIDVRRFQYYNTLRPQPCSLSPPSASSLSSLGDSFFFGNQSSIFNLSSSFEEPFEPQHEEQDASEEQEEAPQKISIRVGGWKKIGGYIGKLVGGTGYLKKPTNESSPLSSSPSSFTSSLASSLGDLSSSASSYLGKPSIAGVEGTEGTETEGESDSSSCSSSPSSFSFYSEEQSKAMLERYRRPIRYPLISPSQDTLYYTHHDSLDVGMYKVELWSDEASELTAEVEVKQEHNGNEIVLLSKQLVVTKDHHRSKVEFRITENDAPATFKMQVHLVKYSRTLFTKSKGIAFTCALSKAVPAEEKDDWNFEETVFNPSTSNLSEKKLKKIEEAILRWPRIIGPDVNAMNYDNSLAIAEMQRESSYKEKAVAKGMIRPFLLLASMHPFRRFWCAVGLEIDLLSESFYGDAHAEAWHILSKPFKGLMGRTRKGASINITWFDILESCCQKIFLSSSASSSSSSYQQQHLEKLCQEALALLNPKKKSTRNERLILSQDPLNSTIPQLEELLQRRMTLYLQTIPQQICLEEARELSSDTAEGRELVSRLKRCANFLEEEQLQFLVGRVLQGQGKELIADVASWIQAEMTSGGKRERQFLLAVVVLMGHKLWLAFGGIRLEDYYISPSCW
ncbi:hypothetical protein QOT17_025272 [Balamuthia mandrillaris]